MTIIGTRQEIDAIKHTCNGRCVDGEWCVFKDTVCPIDDFKGGCMVFEINEQRHTNREFSVLNER